jgi:metal-dependent amidase/aminoacylase/carboxypeptidase family protein
MGCCVSICSCMAECRPRVVEKPWKRLVPLSSHTSGTHIRPEQHGPGARTVSGAEDFSFFQEKIPGLFFFLGVTPDGVDPDGAAQPLPYSFADEAALPIGVRAMTHLTLDYMARDR